MVTFVGTCTVVDFLLQYSRTLIYVYTWDITVLSFYLNLIN